MQGKLTTGELARRVGVNVETIRYYERAGLMPRAQRTASGRRAYDLGDLKTLAFIRKAREFGFHLEDVRALLALRGPDNACIDVKTIAQRHLAQVRAEMRRVIEVERILAEAVGRCPGGPTSACTVLKVLESTEPA
jgi:MerR family mercuric resistance operon transcriptional regulator